jgi:hypothetical protein
VDLVAGIPGVGGVGDRAAVRRPGRVGVVAAADEIVRSPAAEVEFSERFVAASDLPRNDEPKAVGGPGRLHARAGKTRTDELVAGSVRMDHVDSVRRIALPICDQRTVRRPRRVGRPLLCVGESALLRAVGVHDYEHRPGHVQLREGDAESVRRPHAAIVRVPVLCQISATSSARPDREELGCDVFASTTCENDQAVPAGECCRCRVGSREHQQ